MASQFLIVTADSTPQIKAIANEIISTFKQLGFKNIKEEGDLKSGWVIIDLGDVIVHLMNAESRNYYNLEEIWGGGIIYHI